MQDLSPENIKEWSRNLERKARLAYEKWLLAQKWWLKVTFPQGSIEMGIESK